MNWYPHGFVTAKPQLELPLPSFLSSFLPFSFILSLSHSCLCAHTHTHTLLLLKYAYMPQVAGPCSSFKTSLENKVKMSRSRIGQSLCLCLLHLEGKKEYSISFLSPSQHLLLDTICSARTWHSINAC